MNSQYVKWLESKGAPLFKTGDTYWLLTRRMLIPAPAVPYYINLNHEEAKYLLKESGAFFLRYSNNPCNYETEWWYVICDCFDLSKLTSKTRNELKRGNRNCLVKLMNNEWFANNGYTCYYKAHMRYKNIRPVDKDIFRKNTLRDAEGPFEYWGVFYENHLVGYCQCIVEDHDVVTNVVKFDPDFLKYRTAYALIMYLCNHYINERGMTLSNGNRSIAHDTNFQSFLIRLGFRKQFCRLHIVYKPFIKEGMRLLYPIRKLIKHLPRFGPFDKLQSLLFQEELRRFF